MSKRGIPYNGEFRKVVFRTASNSARSIMIPMHGRYVRCSMNWYAILSSGWRNNKVGERRNRYQTNPNRITLLRVEGVINQNVTIDINATVPIATETNWITTIVDKLIGRKNLPKTINKMGRFSTKGPSPNSCWASTPLRTCARAVQ